ncbi:hypothetical protein Droror1_Dr00004006 [Drosera rotundifolia]
MNLLVRVSTTAPQNLKILLKCYLPFLLYIYNRPKKPSNKTRETRIQTHVEEFEVEVENHQIDLKLSPLSSSIVEALLRDPTSSNQTRRRAKNQQTPTQMRACSGLKQDPTPHHELIEHEP